MKKPVLIFLLLLSLGLFARAQESNLTKNISFSAGYSSTLGFHYRNHYQQYSYSDPHSLSGTYDPTYSVSSDEFPVFSLSGEYLVAKRLGVGIDITYSTLSLEKLSGISRMTIGSANLTGLYIMPSVRGYWINGERFKLYSGFYVGAVVLLPQGLDNASAKVDFSIETIPIGMRFYLGRERKFYVLLENLAGTRMLGTRTGFGISF